MKSLVFIALFSAGVQANSVGLSLGFDIWQNEPLGYFSSENKKFEFYSTKKMKFKFFIAAEHPYPILPNARFSMTSFSVSGKSKLTQKKTIDKQRYSKGGEIGASLDLNLIDVTLYYQVLDTDTLSFDMGVTVRDTLGDVAETRTAKVYYYDCRDDYHSPLWCGTNSPYITDVRDTGQASNNEVNFLAYLATYLSLPVEGVSLFAQGDYALSSEHAFRDYQIGLSYDVIDSVRGDLNLILGYQVMNTGLQSFDSLRSNLRVQGAFAGVIAHF